MLYVKWLIDWSIQLICVRKDEKTNTMCETNHEWKWTKFQLQWIQFIHISIDEIDEIDEQIKITDSINF